MRTLFRLALPVALFAIVVSTVEATEPLLKPVTPPKDSTRIRVQTSERDPIFYHVAAKVPNGQKKSELIDVTVAFDSLPGKCYVTVKKWKSWGYEVPANRIGTLPELVIAGEQLAPKPSSGRDAEVRLTNLKVEILEVTNDTVLLCDMLLPINEFTKGNDKAFEPRMYFADKFLEFTVPNAMVKRPGTGGDGMLPEPAINPDKDLVPVAGPMKLYNGVPTFAFASIDGQAQYKLPSGAFETVNVGLASTMNWSDGILMTMGTARGCGLKVEDANELKGITASSDTMVGKAKVKELRLGFVTSPGGKVQKDLVLKDITVIVDKISSNHFVWIGPRFLDAHFADPVYAYGSDGWRLSGRLKPDLLQDIKTRMPPKKP